MHILVVEDDHLQAHAVTSSLERAFPSWKVDLISTEQEFRSRVAEIAQDPPDVIVLDIIVRWTDPAPDLVEWPDDVKNEGHYRAGFRCKEIMARDVRTKNIPVILYTVLELGDLQHEIPRLPAGEINYLRKDGGFESLIQEIRRLTALRTR